MKRGIIHCHRKILLSWKWEFNAKAFQHFLEFLDIKTLILTDIDTTKKVIKEKTRYVACSTDQGTHTSNATLKYFFDSPDVKDEEKYKIWFDKLRNGSIALSSEKLLVSYQKKEEKYHARSFEDAFININLDKLKNNNEKIWGLKNKSEIDKVANIYELTEKILDKKSDFASSVLYTALVDSIEWEIPSYIKEGLKWLAK